MAQQSPALQITAVLAQDEPLALALPWPDCLPEHELLKQFSEGSGMHGYSPLWGAYRGRKLVAAMRAHVQPGRVATLAPPRLVPGETSQTAPDLVSRVLEILAECGVHVVQSLLVPDDKDDAEVLIAGGMRHVAELIYLVSFSAEFDDAGPAEGLKLERYSAAQHSRLASVLQRTYVASLDCPAVEGLHAVEDVLAGYRAAGPFDPARWLVASQGGEDVGCLILSDDSSQNQWELTYFGVVPEARGRGFGLSLVRHAQWMVRQASRTRLVAAVDAANEPALAVYVAAGFINWDRRCIFLKQLKQLNA